MPPISILDVRLINLDASFIRAEIPLHVVGRRWVKAVEVQYGKGSYCTQDTLLHVPAGDVVWPLYAVVERPML